MTDRFTVPESVVMRQGGGGYVAVAHIPVIVRAVVEGKP